MIVILSAQSSTALASYRVASATKSSGVSEPASTRVTDDSTSGGGTRRSARNVRYGWSVTIISCGSVTAWSVEATSGYQYEGGSFSSGSGSYIRSASRASTAGAKNR